RRRCCRVVPRRQQRACLLHRALRVFERSPGRRELARRNPHFIGDLHPCLEMDDRRIGGVDGGLSLAASLGFVVGGGGGGLVRAFAGIDRARKRQPIVSLVDRFARLLQCSGRRGEGLGSVLL